MGEFIVSQPSWMTDFMKSLPEFHKSLSERMQVVIDATKLNIEKRTGGPFGAAVFERDSGKLVSVGVNSVLRHGWSGAHAEAMALVFASQKVGSYDLGGPGVPKHQLVVNGQPCVMCLGSTLWSGVVEVAWGATSAEVEELTGFDEGPVPADYVQQLEKRGVTVITDVRREENKQVIATYKAGNGIIYNSRLGTK